MDEHGRMIRRRVPHTEVLRNPVNEHLIDALPDQTVMHVDGMTESDAEHGYDGMIREDPSREAAIYHNPWTDEYIVIQGETAVVQVAPGQSPAGAGVFQRWKEIMGPDAGAWVLVRHWHPQLPGTRLHQFPSDGHGDMGIVYATANALGQRYQSEIDTMAPWGERTTTTFGYDPTTGKFSLELEVSPGRRSAIEFADIGDYHQFLGLQGGVVNPVPAHMAGGPAPSPDSLVPQAARTGPPGADEVAHVADGEFNKNKVHTGGGHGQENVAALQKNGYTELDPATYRALELAEQPFVEAGRKWEAASAEVHQWTKQRDAFRATVDRSGVGKLNDPGVVGAERAALEQKKQAAAHAEAAWTALNPKPPSAGPRPLPEQHGLPAGYVPLKDRKVFYREPLGGAGAEIGGIVPTRNRIHSDGHTWFPPGWQTTPLMALLGSGDPRLVSKPIKDASGAVTATKSTGWVRRLADGTYELAPDGTSDPAAAGYLKVSLLVPADGAGRTTFPEMNQ